MLKLFSEVLAVGRELSLGFRMSIGWLKKGGRGGLSNTCFFVTGRLVFTSEFNNIRALLISSSSLEPSFISVCSGMGSFGIIYAGQYINLA